MLTSLTSVCLARQPSWYKSYPLIVCDTNLITRQNQADDFCLIACQDIFCNLGKVVNLSNLKSFAFPSEELTFCLATTLFEIAFEFSFMWRCSRYFLSKDFGSENFATAWDLVQEICQQPGWDWEKYNCKRKKTNYPGKVQLQRGENYLLLFTLFEREIMFNHCQNELYYTPTNAYFLNTEVLLIFMIFVHFCAKFCCQDLRPFSVIFFA